MSYFYYYYLLYLLTTQYCSNVTAPASTKQLRLINLSNTAAVHCFSHFRRSIPSPRSSTNNVLSEAVTMTIQN